MEHDEIELDQKRDPRNKGTRFGIKSRGSIKYNIGQESIERAFTGEMQRFVKNSTASVKVSLKKRKNWEISEKSFDDGDTKTRIVILDNNEVFDTRTLDKKLYPQAVSTEGEKPTVVSGTNRKGFFVREKRRAGKKGVNRNVKSLSDGEASSDESDSDEKQIQDEESVLCILTVPREKRSDIWKKGCRGCNCLGCRGYGDKNRTAKTRKLVQKEAVELL